MPSPLITLLRPAFEIAGRGTAVISGISSDEACPVGVHQALVFASPHGVATMGRVTSIEHARIPNFGDEYCLMISEVSFSDIPSGTHVYCHQSLVANRDTSGQPTWTGDLDDDCTAHWAGLVLRAEEMEQRSWWWAVSDSELGSVEIDSSNCHSEACQTGVDARRRAESCASRYLLQQK